MEKNSINAKDALKALMEGNERFMRDELQHPRSNLERRSMLTEGQAPFAIVLTCADSRVVPDLVFDQGIGDLFEIRVAGNVAKDKVLGSIEYAVANLGTKLILVLGHEKCGAVSAALSSGEVPGHVGAILNEIRPAVYMARHQEGDVLENSIKNNAMIMQEKIKDSQPILADMVKEQGVEVVSAYYNLKSGQVEILAE